MIISCPFCSMQGMKKNLADILPNGDIKIIRMRKNEEEQTMVDFTLIQAQDYNIQCGACGNIVYFKMQKPMMTSPIALIPLGSINIYNIYGTN